MTRRSATNRRDQNTKTISRGQHHNDYRRSLAAAAGPVPSRARYSRSAYRNMAQAGRYGEDD